MAGKVGDTLTANVTPDKATNVTYAWYTGDSSTALNTQIAGATSVSYTVTKDELGKFIGVVVKGDNDSTASAVSAVAVAEADATQIAITAAKQTGAKTVDLTISGKATAQDKITVKKGTQEIKIDDTLYTDNGATITLADKITAAEYTVTLTPADTKVKASEAKFTGEVSELKSIEFMNDYLVMKDNNYNVGYCYVKGVDQFGGQVSLSGVTVTAGVGDFQSYDANTGKITIDATGLAQQNPYLLIKEVPVFVQYQEGNNVIVANKTLKVSAKSYVATVEFGEVKKDGTMRDDKKLTVTELNSKKYYIEFNKIKDQYDNDLTADDLNAQKDDDRTLFVIPGDTGAFYTTGQFGTIGGKTVLWITGATRNGTMALTLTGAGGTTFSKDITVDSDPFIQTLSVAWPSLNAQNPESAALDFSAIDQYGNTLNLWEYKPHLEDTNNDGDYELLVFGDENNTTNMSTTISASGRARFNTIKENSSKKTFTVTIDATNCRAKDVEVFTLTTAGMVVGTKSITVGEVGLAAKVKSNLKSGANTQLTGNTYATSDGDNATLNFNKYIQFEDANGDTMSRGDDYYPVFVDGTAINAALAGTGELVDYTKNYSPTRYVWTLTNKKVKAGDNFDDANGPLDPTLATYTASGTGEVSYNEVANNGSDIYVTVYGIEDPNSMTANDESWCIMDSKAFHLTKVTGTDKASDYQVSCTDTLYVNDNSVDDAEVKVVAKTNTGETYNVDASRITLVAAGFSTDENKVKGYTASPDRYSADGTITASVYVDGVSCNDVTIKYSKAEPVAKTAKLKFTTAAGGSDVTSKVGAIFDNDTDADDFTTAAGAEYAIADGKLTINKANDVEDIVEAYIEDQYGNKMADTKFYVDGTLISKTANGAITGARQKIQYANGSVSNSFYLTNTSGTANISYTSTAGTTVSVSSDQELKDALALAAADTGRNYKINVTKSMTLSSALATTSNVAMTVPEDIVVAVTGGLEIAAGSLEVNGTLKTSTVGRINGAGTFKGTGKYEIGNITAANAKEDIDEVMAGTTAFTVVVKTGDITGSPLAPLTVSAGQTLEIAAGAQVKLSAASRVSGIVDVHALGAVLDADGKQVTLYDGAEIISSEVAANIANGGNFVVDAGTVNGVKITESGVGTLKLVTATTAHPDDLGATPVVVSNTTKYVSANEVVTIVGDAANLTVTGQA